MVKHQFKQVVDDLGKNYITLLFFSGVIWTFIAAVMIDTPLFKVSLVYSLMLIFAFLAVSFDRRQNSLGIDVRIWEIDRLKYKFGVAVVFILVWFVFFINSGLSIGTLATAGGTGTFSTNPTLNWTLINFLGPLAEDIFFFGVMNISFIFLIRRMIKNKVQGLSMAGVLLLASFVFFNDIPDFEFWAAFSAGMVALAVMMPKSKMVQKYAPILASAGFIGGLVFPKFHAFAYGLDAQSVSKYKGASWFGFFACIIAALIGLMVVDIGHFANNLWLSTLKGIILGG
jgi:hypothetical protein